MERVRGAAVPRLHELCGVLLSRAQPAHPVSDELAFRGHGRKTGGGVPRPDPPADRQRAATPSEVPPGVRRVSRVVPRARPERPDPLRQLRAGPRRQIVARLPAHRRQRLVPEALSDAAVGAASGGARIRDDGAGLSHRDLGRRGADRARCRHHRHRRPAKARGGVVASTTPGGQRMVRPHPLQPAQRQAEGGDRADHAPAARGRPHRPCIGPGGVGGRAPAGDCRGGRAAPGRDGVRAAGLWPQSG